MTDRGERIKACIREFLELGEETEEFQAGCVLIAGMTGSSIPKTIADDLGFNPFVVKGMVDRIAKADLWSAANIAEWNKEGEDGYIAFVLDCAIAIGHIEVVKGPDGPLYQITESGHEMVEKLESKE